MTSTARILLVGSPLVAALMFASMGRAEEASANGLSVNAWAGAAVDRSVTHVDGGQALHDAAALIGVTALGNVGALAFGAAFDGMPGLFGDGRFALAGLGGWQPKMGRLRLQILGEAGAHRFTDVGANFFAYQVGGATWLPYGGLRVGAARTLGQRGYFDAGAWLFARYDLGRETVTAVDPGFLGSPGTTTDYHVGGFMIGLAIQVGLRFETPRPAPAALAAR